MILFPAIDLKDGACVRLLQGDMTQVTVFNTAPAEQARSFAAVGCTWLHVVDLDGASAGQPVNATAVEAILTAVTLSVQLGGGIRDLARIAFWLEKGVRRVILGTAALYDPALVRTACRLFPGQVAVSVDTRAGRIAVAGWRETVSMTAVELALRFEDAGVAAIIHTDIDRDGVMSGPNLVTVAELAKRITIPVIVAGGVSCLEDLKAIQAVAQSVPKLSGVITGRAIYDGCLDLRQALAVLADENTGCPDSTFSCVCN
ncbi:Phosphoribosylformimino-5-aminoimidazole carboxamide ribotide isomerase [invertebrate metagenome]|uniref:1-(5-phosphoribosyl)-5-[(5-phosphoribosylamino)methylideneamino]imidazole-4-carboxamideisomerase n=1 Tax=invertebrate metagenome TaxID=1711999 RepID=A0A484H8G4_9ZZZZ